MAVEQNENSDCSIPVQTGQSKENASQTNEGLNAVPDPSRNKTQNSANARKGKLKAPWTDLFKPGRDSFNELAMLKFFPPTDDNAKISDGDLLSVKDQWAFACLGCFAGKFPGIKAINALVESWKVNCKFFTCPNDYVLFKFQSEEDRCEVILKGPQYLFGKRLFIETLPENYKLKPENFCILPIWVRLPHLPLECWHPNCLGKIASCIGQPICSDRQTCELRKGKGDFARVLIKVDTSQHARESVLVTLPDGESFRQRIVYELDPIFCLKCKRNDHYWDECSVGSKPDGSQNAQQPVDQAVESPSDGVNVLAVSENNEQNLITSPAPTESVVQQDDDPILPSIPCSDKSSDLPPAIHHGISWSQVEKRRIDSQKKLLAASLEANKLFNQICHDQGISSDSVNQANMSLDTGNSLDQATIDDLEIAAKKAVDVGGFPPDDSNPNAAKVAAAHNELIEFYSGLLAAQKSAMDSGFDQVNRANEGCSNSVESPSSSDFRAALLSPSREQNQLSKDKNRSSNQAFPIPWRVMSMVRGGGRRQPTSGSK